MNTNVVPPAPAAAPERKSLNLQRALMLMAERGGSDLFLSANAPLYMKVNGAMLPVTEHPLGSMVPRAMLSELLTPAQMETLDKDCELNISIILPRVGSFRLSAFKQRNTIAAVVRCIPARIPALDTLKVPESLANLALEKRGLVLMVGATGSGKSTTLSAMLDWRNQSVPGHILTIEDPIEFMFTNKKAVVNQREVGRDTPSLHIGLKNALRQAPDCILIGEIRDRETMAAAISYALSGHLVLATLHANNSHQALGRIISFFPPETRSALQSDLAAALKAILSQRLLRTPQGSRVPAVEVLMNTTLVAEMIERGDFVAVHEAMERAMAPGSQTFEQDLARLYKEGLVTREEALNYADSPSNLLWRLQNETGPVSKVAQAEPEPEGPSFTEITLDINPETRRTPGR